MAEENLGDQLPTKETREKSVSEAVHLVQVEIEAVRKRLEDIACTEKADSILVEGETSTGYDVHIMADPSKIAKIMLRYDYHFWYILDEEVSDDMWLDIAGMVGLEHVSSVDIDLIPKCQNGNHYLEHKN